MTGFLYTITGRVRRGRMRGRGREEREEGRKVRRGGDKETERKKWY